MWSLLREKQASWEPVWYSAHQAVKERHWKEAVEAYDVLIQRYPKSREGFLGMALEARLGRGRAYLKRKVEHSHALLDFGVAAALWPDLVEPSLLMGNTYLLMGEPEEAEKLFKRLHKRARFPDEVA